MLALILAAYLSALGFADAGVPTDRIDPIAAATDCLRYSFEESEDRDADREPDDWIRRRGPEFPSYVKASLDETTAHAGRNSLKVKVNGGRLTYYSPITQAARVDPDFNYVFRGFIRTDRLRNDAAMYSVSFLNHRKERLQRFLTKAVSGSHRDWVKVELGPIVPHPDARFVVIGCHLVTGQEPDLSGNVWYDDLVLGRLPRLTLTGKVQDRYVAPGAPINLSVEVSGVEVGVPFELFMSVSDIKGTVLARRQEPVELTSEDLLKVARTTRFPFDWSIPPQEPGCYFVRTHLNRDGHLMLLGETTIAVLDAPNGRPQGEFGWALKDGYGHLAPRDVAFIGHQAGIHWLKVPLWKAAHGETSHSFSELTDLFEKLSDKTINVIGVLSDPPQAVERRFGEGGVLASDVFAQPREFWVPTLEPVLVRFSNSVDHWQIGSDSDLGFVKTPNLQELLGRVRGEFDRAGRPPKLGIPWSWPNEVEPPHDLGRSFISAAVPADATSEQLARYFENRKGNATDRWILFDLPSTDASIDERALQLANIMIGAKTRDGTGIFAGDVMAPETGLVRADGSPGPLFLPWRTTALALQGARFLGSLRLQNRSSNYVFERNNDVTIVMSSDSPTTERLNLGDKIDLQDLWGRRRKLDRTDGAQVVPVNQSPTFCLGCSAALAKWNLNVGFENTRIPSARGTHPNAIVGRNSFNRAVTVEVTLKLPDEWVATPSSWTLTLPPGDAFRLPTSLQLPDDASLGAVDTTIEFKVVADRQEIVEVYRSLEVGLGDVVVEVHERKLPDGRLEIEQVVFNNTRPEETVEFRCSLSVAGQKRQTRYVTSQPGGKHSLVYTFPNAAALRGQALWLNLEQLAGKRTLNKRQIIGREWQ